MSYAMLATLVFLALAVVALVKMKLAVMLLCLAGALVPWVRS